MNDLLAEPFINQPDENAPAKLAHEDFERIGGARYYHRLVQGCQEWMQMRLGIVTASEMNKILTATLKVANNKDTRTQLFELLAQRITQHVDPQFVSYDMERGKLEEISARQEYEKHYGKVQQCGFIINDELGFDVGFSPDGLVGDLGFIESKSRVAKYQVQTILEHIAPPDPDSVIPIEYMLQCQTGLFVTGREWCDFLSYSNGLNMAVIRVKPIEAYQLAIKSALISTEEKLKELMENYHRTTLAEGVKIHPVKRIDHSTEIEA